MELIVQTAVLGVLIGGIYALIALGLSLTFGVMKIVNFAQGSLFMVGGFAAYLTSLVAGLPAIAAVFTGMLAGAFIGYLIDVVIMRPIRQEKVDKAADYAVISTYALSLLLSAGAIATFGGTYRTVDGFWDTRIVLGEWVKVSGDRVFAFGMAIVFVAVLFWLVYRTDIGRGWRAITQSSLGAKVVGINQQRLSNLAFATAGGLAGAAGALLTPLFFVYPGIDEMALLKAFAVVIIGGLGSIGGTLIAALLLGLVEAFGTGYLSAEYRDAYGFLLMIAVLLIRPQGLFGKVWRMV